MLLVMVAIGGTDLLFALDSIPAIFGLTQNVFIVFTATAFSLLGLRQLYFLINGLLDRLIYLSYGLAIILAFIGVKLVLHALHENNVPFINGGEHVDVVEITTGLSLSVILGVLAVTVVASLLSAAGQGPALGVAAAPPRPGVPRPRPRRRARGAVRGLRPGRHRRAGAARPAGQAPRPSTRRTASSGTWSTTCTRRTARCPCADRRRVGGSVPAGRSAGPVPARAGQRGRPVPLARPAAAAAGPAARTRRGPAAGPAAGAARASAARARRCRAPTPPAAGPAEPRRRRAGPRRARCGRRRRRPPGRRPPARGSCWRCGPGRCR